MQVPERIITSAFMMSKWLPEELSPLPSAPMGSILRLTLKFIGCLRHDPIASAIRNLRLHSRYLLKLFLKLLTLKARWIRASGHQVNMTQPARGLSCP